jgi:hypothetical protein
MMIKALLLILLVALWAMPTFATRHHRHLRPAQSHAFLEGAYGL